MTARTSGLIFESLESAREYVGLLCEALDDQEDVIAHEISSPSAMTGARHLDALRLVDLKLKTLRTHLLVSRRLLGDLRSLRRYLLDERASDRTASEDPTAASATTVAPPFSM